jgi:hypothetical protein
MFWRLILWLLQLFGRRKEAAAVDAYQVEARKEEAEKLAAVEKEKDDAFEKIDAADDGGLLDAAVDCGLVQPEDPGGSGTDTGQSG